jgi:hypothetical protein
MALASKTRQRKKYQRVRKIVQDQNGGLEPLSQDQFYISTAREP